MVHASLRNRSGRALALVLGGLLLAGLIGLMQFADAAPNTKAPAKGTGKGPTGPTSLKMTIVSETPDVAEMSKVINAALSGDWTKNKITPSFYVDDYEFIRRASLDIIGRIARPDEIRRYMKDAPDRRRSLLVDRLLKSDDYPRHWANLWANWLLTRAGDFGRGKYHDQMVVWLEDQFAQNRSYHQIVTKLITASGSNDKNGAVNFILAHLGEPTPNKANDEGKNRRAEEGDWEMVPLTSRLTRVFLGIQVQCSQCHAHPFSSALQQRSFWGINAFLRQVKRDGGAMRRPARNMVRPDLTLRDDENVNPEANVFYETRGAKVVMMQAEFMAPAGKTKPTKLDISKKGVARREELARLLTEHDMFTKAIVNRMWGLFYGRGFVNPIDDFNDNNQPSNPELLDELASRFKHYNYDLKKLIRWMTHSNAYHLSYVANKTNDKPEHEPLFSRMVMKALSPEQLLESLLTATQRDKALSTPAAKKEVRDKWLGQLITNFGDDEGNEITFNGTIVQALLLMNGTEMNDAIKAEKGTVATAMATLKTRPKVINELYLAALNRPPRRAELANLNTKLLLTSMRNKDKEEWQYQDLFWALLNSNEFLLNH